MRNQVLYDKEISVTLYKTLAVSKPKYKVHSIQGYKTDTIAGKRVLYSAGGEDININAVTGASYPTTSYIEFYEGNTRKVFAGYKKLASGKEKAVYKKILGSGNTVNVNTLDDMKRGVRPDGSPFITGDKIRVKEDNSTWVAYVQGSQESLLTEEKEIIQEDAVTLTIGSPNSGIKPDVALTINLLPGQNVYGATLKVRNLNIDAVNIREWTRMVITAGYRTGAKAIYVCPIFSSYIESPNPDGITTFEGVTVGSSETMFDDQWIEIRFNEENMTIEELTLGVAKGIADNIHVNIFVDKDIMSTPITVTKQKVYAQNGLAILNWLQTTISGFISEATGGETTALVQMVNGEVNVIAINGPNSIPVNKENIINLDMVMGATFNGTALTVEAPWNPALHPGDLFFLPPNFINGSKLPNILDVSDYRNDDNLYRVLTMNVTFATVEHVNKMTILAVPAQWAGQLPSAKDTSMSGELLARALAADADRRITRPIDVGKINSKDLNAIRSTEQRVDTKIEMFDKFQDLERTWGQGVTITIDPVITGSCLSKVFEYYFLEYPNGPKLGKDQKGEGTEYHYWKSKDDLKGNTKALSHFQNSGLWANLLWWPLTVVYTYWKKRYDDDRHASNNWTPISLDNPDFIREGYSLYIPPFPGSWSSAESKLKENKDLWKYAYQTYQQYGPMLSNTWRAAYYYFGGTSDLG